MKVKFTKVRSANNYVPDGTHELELLSPLQVGESMQLFGSVGPGKPPYTVTSPVQRIESIAGGISGRTKTEVYYVSTLNSTYRIEIIQQLPIVTLN